MFRFLSLSTLLVAASASAQTIFDSGQPTGPGSVLSGGYYCDLPPAVPWTRCQNWLASKISLRDAAQITTVEAYLSSMNEGIEWEPEEGLIYLRLRLDENGLPGPVSQTVELFMDDNATGWVGPNDLAWALEAGDYWISYEVPRIGSKFDGGWQSGAAIPAAGASFMHGDFQNQEAHVWKALPVESYKFGLRILGSIGPTGAGDINRDGLIDVRDLDLLGPALRAGETDTLYDINLDLSVDLADWEAILGLLGTFPGDATLDGIFNSGDLIQVFGAGEYENGILQDSTWVEGDFDGNGDFNSSDLISALATGRYESAQAAVVVPEPGCLVWILLGLLAWRKENKPC